MLHSPTVTAVFQLIMLVCADLRDSCLAPAAHVHWASQHSQQHVTLGMIASVAGGFHELGKGSARSLLRLPGDCPDEYFALAANYKTSAATAQQGVCSGQDPRSNFTDALSHLIWDEW